MANYITEMGKLAEIEVFNCVKKQTTLWQNSIKVVDASTKILLTCLALDHNRCWP